MHEPASVLPPRAALIVYLRQVSALALKDLRLESRRRETVAGVLVFVLLVLGLFQFALDLERAEARRIVPGVLWIRHAERRGSMLAAQCDWVNANIRETV